MNAKEQEKKKASQSYRGDSSRHGSGSTQKDETPLLYLEAGSRGKSSRRGSSRRGSEPTLGRSRDRLLCIEEEKPAFYLEEERGSRHGSSSSRRGSGSVHVLRINSAEPLDADSTSMSGRNNRPDPESASEVLMLQDEGSASYPADPDGEYHPDQEDCADFGLQNGERSPRKYLEDPPLKPRRDPTTYTPGSDDVSAVSSIKYLEDPPLKPNRDPTMYIGESDHVSAVSSWSVSSLDLHDGLDPSARSPGAAARGPASSNNPHTGRNGGGRQDPSTHGHGSAARGSATSVGSIRRGSAGRDASYYSQSEASHRSKGRQASGARGLAAEHRWANSRTAEASDASFYTRESRYTAKASDASFYTRDPSVASFRTRDPSHASEAGEHGNGSCCDSYYLEDSFRTRTSARSRKSSRAEDIWDETSR